MHRQVVEHDDIAGPQRWHQDLFDVREKRWAIDGPIEDRGRRQSIEAQSRNDRMRLPMTTRRVVMQAGATGAAPIATQQIGRDAALIEKDVLADIAQWLPRLPLAARCGNIRTTLFVGVYGFF
jgi:hypothetical protein